MSDDEETRNQENDDPELPENKDGENEPDAEEGNITNQEPEAVTPRGEPTATRRITQTPVWMKGYVTGEGNLFVIDGEDVMAMYTASEDPDNFDEAVQHEKWREAMELEIKSIEENNTWEVVDLPEEAKVIGVKWIFKTKYNEKGEVDKFKARLVAKGYHQRLGVDFHEVFAPVARWDTIRTLLAKAAEKEWKVFQLDVKSAFLQGDLNEDVYIEQPRGFELKEDGDKVYKLRKALYGLRQAPRAWYSRLEGYFAKEGFKKCYCEHTLFIKTEKEQVLIVSVYVDDLIYTGNSETLLKHFKISMMKEFAMTDLGMMKYFLGVEVTQDEHGIFISQQKYAVEILDKFGMESCNSVRNTIVPGQKLSKE